MKSKSVGSIFLVLTLVAAVLAFTPVAFAESKVEVKIAKDSSIPTIPATPATPSTPARPAISGCDETKSCYQPDEITVDVGDEVTWTNDDTSSHTVTSGDPLAGGPDGKFDSSLVTSGQTFSHKFTEAGTYKYFCVVHAWMAGVVTVQAAAGGGMQPGGEKMENAMYVKGMSSDGSIQVEIEASPPKAGEEMPIKVTFTKADGSGVQHINYDITATQDGTEVLSAKGAHEHQGVGMHKTSALTSDNPVDIKVTILGIGLPGETWTGPQSDIVSLQVVPEFGAIATVVLAIAVVSIIAVTAKTRVIPKL